MAKNDQKSFICTLQSHAQQGVDKLAYDRGFEMKLIYHIWIYLTHKNAKSIIFDQNRGLKNAVTRTASTF